MNKAIETLKAARAEAVRELKAARAEAVREFDEAIAKLSSIRTTEPVTAPSTPKAKVAATRVVSEETKAKMRAAHAARKAAKMNGPVAEFAE